MNTTVFCISVSCFKAKIFKAVREIVKFLRAFKSIYLRFLLLQAEIYFSNKDRKTYQSILFYINHKIYIQHIGVPYNLCHPYSLC